VEAKELNVEARSVGPVWNLPIIVNFQMEMIGDILTGMLMRAGDSWR
jgi:hypothetical protein